MADQWDEPDVSVVALMLAQGASGTGWTPAALSPVEWWDLDDAATVTTASGALSSITSKGSGARTASQATAGNRPTMTTQNGRVAATFDGTNDFLSLSSNYPTTSSMTVAAVFGRASAGIITLPIGGATAGQPPYGPQWWSDNVRYSALWATGFVTHGSASSATGVFQHIVRRAPTPDNTSLHQDGTLVGTPSTSATNASGDLAYLGRRGADYHAGLICEVVAIASVLDEANRQRLEGYLAHKWGMAGSLPGDHPYKASPP